MDLHSQTEGALKALARAGYYQAASKTNREGEWHAAEALRAPWYPGTAERILSELRSQESEVVSAVVDMFASKNWNPGRIWQMVSKWIKGWDTMTPWVVGIINAGESAGRARVSGIVAEFSETLPVGADELEQRILARQVLRSKIVSEYTAGEIVRRLNEVAETGERDMRKYRSAVRELFRGWKNWRVDRITNTVVVGAYHAGVIREWERDGLVTGKSWVSALDGRVRDTHSTRLNPHLLDAIPLSSSFRVGSSRMSYPGDPEGEAKEVINCRCTLAPEII